MITNRGTKIGAERDVDMAIHALKTARRYLVIAGASRAADKVRRALKSAEGARRHAEGMTSRAVLNARQERA